MCRGKKSCSELGVDPQNWSKDCPLISPEWFSKEISTFANAVFQASIGNKTKSIEILNRIRSNELRDWYVEHSQVSGNFRNRLLRVKTQTSHNILLDSQRSPDPYAKEIFERDNYICRYCGTMVVPKQVLVAYSKAVGDDVFRATGTNAQRHGIVLAFRANADHVVPWKLGGKTNPDNLVTACWSCNYGKSGYTLEELGLNDPREKTTIKHGWDGLVSLLDGLKKYCL